MCVPVLLDYANASGWPAGVRTGSGQENYRLITERSDRLICDMSSSATDSPLLWFCEASICIPILVAVFTFDVDLLIFAAA